MRILVTGTGGFAGGHVARQLACDGHHVYALTRGSVVEPPKSTDDRQRFEIVNSSLESVDGLPMDIDAVVHAAATSIWPGISVDRMLVDNVWATRTLINHAMRTGCEAFIFFSSISAFGRIDGTHLDETNPTVNPDAYGATKLLGEQHLADIADDLPSLAIRLPAIIGPGSKRNWPSELLRKLKAGEPVSYFNPDTPFNNVVHTTDLAILVQNALQKGLSGNKMVVIASGGKTTSGWVVDTMARKTASISTVNSYNTEHRAFLIDHQKATDLFDYSPMHVERAIIKHAAGET